MKAMKLSAVLIAAVSLAGCGALFNSGPETVRFTSSPDEAEVYVNGTPRGRTPLTLDLPKNQSYTVLFKRSGFEDWGTTVDKQIRAKWVILDVLGGVLPVIVDAATGSWYKLSATSVHGILATADAAPESSRSAAAAAPDASLSAMEVEPDGILTPRQLALVRLGIPLDRAIELAHDQK